MRGGGGFRRKRANESKMRKKTFGKCPISTEGLHPKTVSFFQLHTKLNTAFYFHIGHAILFFCVYVAHCFHVFARGNLGSKVRQRKHWNDRRKKKRSQNLCLELVSASTCIDALTAPNYYIENISMCGVLIPLKRTHSSFFQGGGEGG